LADAAQMPSLGSSRLLGMTLETLEKHYGHHHADYLREAAQTITSKQPKNVPLVVSLVEPERRRKKTQ
jgi:hypothetical protein